MQNQTILELYTDDNKSKYFANPKDIVKSSKNLRKALHQQTQPLEVFYKKGVLKNFVNFIGKHLCQSL